MPVEINLKNVDKIVKNINVMSKWRNSMNYFDYVARNVTTGWTAKGFTGAGLGISVNTLYAVNTSNHVVTVDQDTGKIIKQIGTDTPECLTANQTGMIAYGQSTVHILNASGTQIAQFSYSGGQFYTANNIAIAPNGVSLSATNYPAGGLYFPETYFYDASGKSIKILDYQAIVGADNYGNFYVFSDSDSKLHKFNNSANELWSVSIGTYYVTAIVATSNRIYIVDPDTGKGLVIFDGNGKFVKLVQIDEAQAMSLDELGYIYVCDYNGNVYKFDQDGNQIWKIKLATTMLKNISANKKVVYVLSPDLNTIVKLVQS